MPVAEKLTGLPLMPVPVAVAVSVFAPAMLPSTQAPTVAMPDAPVVCAAPTTEPAPAVAAKLTAAPETGLSNASVTRTEGAVPTAWPTVAV